MHRSAHLAIVRTVLVAASADAARARRPRAGRPARCCRSPARGRPPRSTTPTPSTTPSPTWSGSRADRDRRGGPVGAEPRQRPRSDGHLADPRRHAVAGRPHLPGRGGRTVDRDAGSSGRDDLGQPGRLAPAGGRQGAGPAADRLGVGRAGAASGTGADGGDDELVSPVEPGPAEPALGRRPRLRGVGASRRRLRAASARRDRAWWGLGGVGRRCAARGGLDARSARRAGSRPTAWTRMRRVSTADPAREWLTNAGR